MPSAGQSEAIKFCSTVELSQHKPNLRFQLSMGEPPGEPNVWAHHRHWCRRSIFWQRQCSKPGIDRHRPKRQLVRMARAVYALWAAPPSFVLFRVKFARCQTVLLPWGVEFILVGLVMNQQLSYRGAHKVHTNMDLSFAISSQISSRNGSVLRGAIAVIISNISEMSIHFELLPALHAPQPAPQPAPWQALLRASCR